MKCNHCKKTIPQGEEIIIDKKEEKKYLHEDCLTRLEREEKEKELHQKEQTRKIFVRTGLGMATLMLLIGIYTLKPAKYYSDYETPKFFIWFGVVALLATGAFWITSYYWALFVIPFIALFIWAFKLES